MKKSPNYFIESNDIQNNIQYFRNHSELIIVQF